MIKNTFFCILAGGSGSRLWPLSRSDYPKHFLNLKGDQSLLQDTVARVQKLVPQENIIIITTEKQIPLIKKQLPWVQETNLVLEPQRNSTSACIGLAAVKLQKRDPHSVMVVLPSDQYIKQQNDFHHVIKQAIKMAGEYKGLITLGIYPFKPHTGYGYIACGEKIKDLNHHSLFRVDKFTEKPDKATAQAFLASGKYFWNSGIFIWQTEVIMKAFQKFMPELYEGLVSLQKIKAKDKIAYLYGRLPKKTIDYAILEKHSQVYLIPSDFGWSDVGDWSTLGNFLAPYPESNLTLQGKNIDINSQGCLVHVPKGKIVATIGLKNVVIVERDNAILVCKKDRAHLVKEVVHKLKEKGENDYL